MDFIVAFGDANNGLDSVGSPWTFDSGSESATVINVAAGTYQPIFQGISGSTAYLVSAAAFKVAGGSSFSNSIALAVEQDCSPSAALRAINAMTLAEDNATSLILNLSLPDSLALDLTSSLLSSPSLAIGKSIALAENNSMSPFHTLTSNPSAGMGISADYSPSPTLNVNAMLAAAQELDMSTEALTNIVASVSLAGLYGLSQSSQAAFLNLIELASNVSFFTSPAGRIFLETIACAVSADADAESKLAAIEAISLAIENGHGLEVSNVANETIQLIAQTNAEASATVHAIALLTVSLIQGYTLGASQVSNPSIALEVNPTLEVLSRAFISSLIDCGIDSGFAATFGSLFSEAISLGCEAGLASSNTVNVQRLAALMISAIEILAKLEAFRR